MKRKIESHFAHRGLWDERIPENSLPAFRAAVEAGWGIELDLQLSSDGRVMVFHDYALSRMTGAEGKLSEKTFAALRELRLAGSEETIPTLEEVLEVVAGRTMILIELKGESTDTAVCAAADRILREYRGTYIVESFNPFLLRWYKRNRPDVTRGLLSTKVCKEKKVSLLNILLDSFWLNPLCSPHFIAYDIRYGRRLPIRIALKLGKMPVVWTVRREEDFAALDARGIPAIFEKIRPQSPKEKEAAWTQKAENLRRTLDSADGKKELSLFGKTEASAETLGGLQKEIDALEAKGHMVSFILADIEGEWGVAYNCNKEWTSQSTIKAPYLTSVLRKDPAVFSEEQKRIKAVITVSSNEDYEGLREKYGKEPFEEFCALSDIDFKHAQVLYPRAITVRDMAKLWTNMVAFLNTTTLSEYVSYFTGTAMSCIYQGIGDRYRVQTKAGWESGTDFDGPGGEPAPRFIDGDPSNDEIATNDTGVVYAGEHPYILAIFTNLQTDPPSLLPLVRAIDDAHGELVK